MKWLLTWTLPLLMSGAALACRSPFLKTPPKDRGGFFLVVAVKGDEARRAESVEQTMNVFRRRCERLELYCDARRQEGKEPNRVVLRVSGAKDVTRVKEVLLAEGLKLSAAVSPPYPSPAQIYPTREAAEAAAGADEEALPYDEEYAEPGDPESFLIVKRVPVIVGDDVRHASAVSETGESGGNYSIHFTFRPEAAARFERWTSANINNYLAVILNGRVVTAPYIRSAISADGVINGSFNKERAEETALVLMSGNLPAPVELVEEGTYRP